MLLNGNITLVVFSLLTNADSALITPSNLPDTRPTKVVTGSYETAGELIGERMVSSTSSMAKIPGVSPASLLVPFFNFIELK
jgi:hypothetical protein